jgi:type I restriction enzyme M protein
MLTRLARTDFPDFNDPNKLGQGKDPVELLGDLIAVFEKPELNFSKNRADQDDLLGDAYEYLMRHFATESGTSKGQFYIPAEVSRTMAKVIGISPANTKASNPAYDPTSGSGFRRVSFCSREMNSSGVSNHPLARCLQRSGKSVVEAVG